MSRYMHSNDGLKHLIFWNGGSIMQYQVQSKHAMRGDCSTLECERLLGHEWTNK
jgi:hypothetical protein